MRCNIKRTEQGRVWLVLIPENQVEQFAAEQVVDTGVGAVTFEPFEDTPDLEDGPYVVDRDRPDTLSDVESVARDLGGDSLLAETFWHHYQSTGWLDGADRPIRSWKSKLRTWIIKARSMPEGAKTSGANVVVWGRELERVEASLKTLRSSYEAMQSWTKDDIRKRKELKVKRLELRKKLGLEE